MADGQEYEEKGWLTSKDAIRMSADAPGQVGLIPSNYVEEFQPNPPLPPRSPRQNLPQRKMPTSIHALTSRVYQTAHTYAGASYCQMFNVMQPFPCSLIPTIPILFTVD
jgi:hypothetical protein